MDRSRILGAIAVTLLALGNASADPLQLSCSGTRTAQGGSAAPVTASAEIDIDNSKVRSSMGDMSIVTNNATGVGARGYARDGAGVTVYVSLWYDRTTGQASSFGCYEDWINGTSDKQCTVAWFWDLTCKAAP